MTSGEIQAGNAHARFEPDDQERMRMILEWRWLTGGWVRGAVRMDPDLTPSVAARC